MINETDTARRLALQRLIDRRFGGNKSAFARLMEYKGGGSYVGQMLRDEKPITEKTEYKIGQKIGDENWVRRYQERAAEGATDDAEHVRYGYENPAKPVPVIGKTMGGIPDRIWDDEGRPTGITEEYGVFATSDPQAFLCRVEGTSMAPRYQPGEFALVEPNVAPEIEDDVLVRLVEGCQIASETTLLKRLLSRKGGIRLGSYDPAEPVINLQEKDILWMYYVAHPVPARKIRSRF